MRLKGGDPAVFSRVSSELAALSAAGIPYEIVPGISSALAAPVLAVSFCSSSADSVIDCTDCP